MKKSLVFIFIFIFAGCTASDISQITNAALSGDPRTAVLNIAKRKAVNVASSELSKIIARFEKEIKSVWGEDVHKPDRKKYVKYTQNYKSMAEVDFDKGTIVVRTIDDQNPEKSLKNAIVTTLLTPNDPRAVDLYSSSNVKLSGTPYLYKELKDHTGKYIRYPWRAENFADYLIKNKILTKIQTVNNKDRKVYFVKIDMVKDHMSVRAKKYKSTVEKYSNQYSISKNLIFSIMKAESNFNPFATSYIPAYGLMQIVPKSAGRDSYKYIYKRDKIPSKEYLYNTTNNIRLGTAYIKLIKTNYLGSIKDPLSKEYCSIAAYNTGSGNVLRTFSKNRTKAVEIINSMKPSEVYETLVKKLPYKETRNYLVKVIRNKKEFIKL